jgi:hypothetical protein
LNTLNYVEPNTQPQPDFHFQNFPTFSEPNNTQPQPDFSQNIQQPFYQQPFQPAPYVEQPPQDYTFIPISHVVQEENKSESGLKNVEIEMSNCKKNFFNFPQTKRS